MVESATEQTRVAETSASAANVDIWSTGTVCAREKVSYWRETVSGAVFGISVETIPEQFSARITARNVGPLRFAISESTGYQISRSRRDIDARPSDHYSIYLQLSGQTVSSMNDDTSIFNANDLGVYDGRQPFRAMHGGKRAIAVMPRSMLERRAPWLTRRPHHKLAADSPFAELARQHLMTLADPDSSLSETAISMLNENLCNLVALASADGVEPGRLQPELQLEAILAFCRQHLHDAELSPQHAADRLGMSVRTLHWRFKQTGQTFGRWVRENRLDGCAVALRDSNQRAFNISEIAYNWGFNDLSHFNKAFRARFNMTPREWRHEPKS
jgi:AraC family transcriptional activator of tynA and feaB